MSTFHFREFSIEQSQNSMKVGTDALVLGSMASCGGARLLDVGAGTGVLSLMMAQRFPLCVIDAIEIDVASSRECSVNFERSPWAHRLNVYETDFLDYHTSHLYDTIISNPPYFSNGLLNQDTRKAQSRHVASLPIVPFLMHTSELLSSDGEFWCIFPWSDRLLWMETAESAGLYPWSMIDVIGKRDEIPVRAIGMFKKKSCAVPTTESFVIREPDGKYSRNYIELTVQFHDRDISQQ